MKSSEAILSYDPRSYERNFSGFFTQLQKYAYIYRLIILKYV